MLQVKQTPFDLSSTAQSGVMSDHLVRVANLRAIQRANDWNDSELARQCGRAPQQVHAWLVGKRPIAEKLARSLEEKLGLLRYALDDRSTPGLKAPKVDRFGDQLRLPTAIKRAKELPVLAWTDIAKMLDADNAALKQKATHLETFAVASAKAKFLQMPDDSMADEISAGDVLLIDPTEAPRAGDIVLVSINDGTHHVRKFRPRTAEVFEASPANTSYQALSSKEDGATVLGVMVEHRRYRRAIP